MSADAAWEWWALVGLGAFHGLNPAMGWLFAVAIGLQDRSRAAVLRALVPIALGHEVAIVLAVALVRGAEVVSAPDALRLLAAGLLVLFGAFKFVRPRAHPRWVGMRVTMPELALWSFLMSSAHGAGLMLFPVLLGLHAHGAAEASELPGVGASLAEDAAAVLVHTLAMVLTMGAIALVVYEKVGVGFLRWAWINLDLVWATAFVVVGVATLFT